MILNRKLVVNVSFESAMPVRNHKLMTQANLTTPALNTPIVDSSLSFFRVIILSLEDSSLYTVERSVVQYAQAFLIRTEILLWENLYDSSFHLVRSIKLLERDNYSLRRDENKSFLN